LWKMIPRVFPYHLWCGWKNDIVCNVLCERIKNPRERIISLHFFHEAYSSGLCKKSESPYFTRDRFISYYYYYYYYSLYVKNINIYFFLFFSLLISFSFSSCSSMSSSSFFFYPLSFFLINMLYENFFLSLASLTTTLR
jgi:hypothetical protein